jgi:hypothetical protein
MEGREVVIYRHCSTREIRLPFGVGRTMALVACSRISSEKEVELLIGKEVLVVGGGRLLGGGRWESLMGRNYLVWGGNSG